MNITREIIIDLLPLYLSGEASDDTRSLVEEYVKAHPEMRECLDLMSEANTLMTESSNVELGAADLGNAEKDALQRIRRTVRYRSGALGMAIAYTLAPFSFVYSEGHFHWLLLGDYPQAGKAFLGLAAGFWILYAWLRVKTNKGGI